MSIEYPSPPDYLLTSNVAKILECSPDLVRLLERNGKLKAMKTIGGWRLFSRKDVELLALKRSVAKRAKSKIRKKK